jgi:DNA-binding MarR family transcriptional regulator
MFYRLTAPGFEYLIRFMQPDSRQIPSDDDLQQAEAQIFALLRQKRAPVPLEEIAQHLHTDRAIVEGYLDRLADAGSIYYVPMGRGLFGYFAE